MQHNFTQNKKYIFLQYFNHNSGSLLTQNCFFISRVNMSFDLIPESINGQNIFLLELINGTVILLMSS